MEAIRLNGGGEMPRLGLGTWRLAGDGCVEVVKAGLRLGYRHLDTAQMYANEAEVGRGMREAGVPRGEIFLTTKIWPDRHGAAEFARAVDESLTSLRMEHVDLLLLHWPSQQTPLAEAIGALNAALTAGKTRAIGLSNFTVKLMHEAAALSAAPLAVNQIEYHLLLRQSKVLAAARELGMAITAYRPLGKGAIQEYALLTEIGARHGKSAAQVALRWLVQQEGVCAIPKMSSEANLRANLEIFDFELTAEDLARIATLPGDRRFSDAAWAPPWDVG